MIGSTKKLKRLQKTLDLRTFDGFVEKELNKHIPMRLGETTSASFMPALYQRLANELAYYKGRIYAQERYLTHAFRAAYDYEDQNEIIDELCCELSMRLCALLGVPRLTYGVRIQFITHNQWLIDYVEKS